MVWGILFLIDIHTLCLSNKGHIQIRAIFKNWVSTYIAIPLFVISNLADEADKEKQPQRTSTMGVQRQISHFLLVTCVTTMSADTVTGLMVFSSPACPSVSFECRVTWFPLWPSQRKQDSLT